MHTGRLLHAVGYFAVTATVFSSCSESAGPTGPKMGAPSFSLTAEGVIDLGTLGGSNSSALAVNADTQVVGSSSTGSGSHAFLWTPQTGMQDLTPDADGSQASGINDQGTIVGQVRQNPSDPLQAFRMESGGALQLLEGLSSGTAAQAFDINNLGIVVGLAEGTEGFSRAVRWGADGVIEDLGTLGGQYSEAYAVNDAGVVVGMAEDGAGNLRAFKKMPGGGMEALPTPFGGFSVASDVNEDGVVVGEMTTVTGATHAVIWTPDGQVIDLGTLGGTSSGAGAINNDGVVVGSSRVGSGATHAFVWSPSDSVMRDLSEQSGAATSISGNGLVAGRMPATGFSRATLWLLAEHGGAEASLSCTGATRGEWVECKLTIEPSGAAVEVIGWKFTDGAFLVEEARDSLTWSGYGVVSGLVTTDLSLNGDTVVVSDGLFIEPAHVRYLDFELLGVSAQPG